MKTCDFDYKLPKELIAQKPARPRHHSRLMILDKQSGAIQHRRFFQIGEFLRSGDLLVLNESRVFKARLTAVIARSGNDIEIFLLHPEGKYWLALAKPARKLKSGDVLTFSDDQTGKIIEKRDNGTILIDFGKSAEDVFAWADRVGEVPLPPYIKKVSSERCTVSGEMYQTVYAKTIGSVAAPTAGFHFTPELIEKLKAHGINFATVTLHVGLGTFRPIKTDTLEEHVLHEEWISVPYDTRSAIQATRQHGGRVIAVGTTTVRALESINPLYPPYTKGELKGVGGFTKLFITPGYKFKNIDGLITNFHLPKSTLLVLVSAFADDQPRGSEAALRGREFILKAYAEAIQEKYRFYSFGDAMLILEDRI